MNSRFLVICSLVLALAGAPAVGGETERQAIPWDDLSADEQEVLEPFQHQWDQLPGVKQHRLQKGAKRWKRLNPEQKERMQQRFQRWEKLPQHKKERIRKRFERFQQLPEHRKRALRERRRWFKNLPKEQRRELRDKWQNLSPQKRRDLNRLLNRDRLKRGGHPFSKGAFGRPGGRE